MNLDRNKKQSNYWKFIKEISRFYKSGFTIMSAVFAGALLNLFANRLNNLENVFGWNNILWIFVYSLMFLFLSVIIVFLFSFFSVIVLGSFAFWVGKLSNKIYEKTGVIFVTVLALIFVISGALISKIYGISTIKGVLGVLLVLIGVVPLSFMISNKPKNKEFIPSYVG